MRALLLFLSLALMFSSVSFAAPFNARGAVDSLKASGLKLKFGKSTDTGFYVVCKETVTVRDGNIAEAQEKAKMQARVSIAEFIAGAHIKVRESSGKTTRQSIVNDEESFESAEYIKKSMQKDVRQVQRGITICAMDKNNE
jgi:cAMP phosphodiesterase